MFSRKKYCWISWGNTFSSIFCPCILRTLQNKYHILQLFLKPDGVSPRQTTLDQRLYPSQLKNSMWMSVTFRLSTHLRPMLYQGMITRSFEQAYLFNDYWEDIGTIRSFFEANLALTEHVKTNILQDNSISKILFTIYILVLLISLTSTPFSPGHLVSTTRRNQFIHQGETCHHQK